MTSQTGNQPQSLPKGAEVELTIEGLDVRGEGWGQVAGRVMRTRHAVPGSRVRVKVLRKRSKRAWGRVLEVLEPGPDTTDPNCTHFGTCGGCAFQNLAYPAQLEALRHRVQQELERVGIPVGGPMGEPAGVPVDAVLASPSLWHYRNKMDFTFGSRRWRSAQEIEEHGEERDATFALGLHAPGRYDKVLDLEACTIAFEEASPILRSARELSLEQGLLPWDVRTHSGLLRHLVMRKGHFTGEILVVLVTSEDAPAEVDAWAVALRERQPEITTLVQVVNSRPAAVAMGERQRVLYGRGVIRERLAGLEYSISAGSFFQTNSAQAEQLMRVVREEVQLDQATAPLVWDLYCGAGTFALDLARSGARVLGIESIASAVADARHNARANGLQQVEFLQREVENCIGEAGALGAAPDVCVVDPPRAGLHPRALPALAAVPARRLILVSCNPEAGARDVAALAQAGWELRRVRPLDLFPHTPHVECVLSMERVG